jgi:hypothetical protein
MAVTTTTTKEENIFVKLNEEQNKHKTKICLSKVEINFFSFRSHKHVGQRSHSTTHCLT